MHITQVLPLFVLGIDRFLCNYKVGRMHGRKTKSRRERVVFRPMGIAVMPRRNANTCSLKEGWQEGRYDGKMGLIIFCNLYILKYSRIQ